MLTSALLAIGLLSGPGLHFIDVGQGSALLVLGPGGQAVLVDAGPPGADGPVLAALAAHGVTEVKLWVFTHFDADHVGGTPAILAGLDGLRGTPDDPVLTRAWDRGLDDLPDTDVAVHHLDAVWDVRRTVSDGDLWTRDGLQVRVLAGPALGEAAHENARGLALCIDVQSVRVFVPGDLPSDIAAELAVDCEGADLLWLGHHGSRNATGAELLDRVPAPLVIVSAGFRNGYCHPHPDVVALLRDRRVWMTGAAGIGPGDDCAALGPALGSEHHVAAADLWFPVSG